MQCLHLLLVRLEAERLRHTLHEFLHRFLHTVAARHQRIAESCSTRYLLASGATIASHARPTRLARANKTVASLVGETAKKLGSIFLSRRQSEHEVLLLFVAFNTTRT